GGCQAQRPVTPGLFGRNAAARTTHLPSLGKNFSQSGRDRATDMPGPHRRRRSPLSLVEQELDVRFYLHRLTETGSGPVLVVGAANGRVAWELARHASRVLAVEPSDRMIAVAESQRSEHPADAAARLRFVCADLRSLRLGEQFPLVVAPQNALGL